MVLDPFQASLLQHADQLGEDELDPLADTLVGIVELSDRELGAVEHREELLDERLVRPADGVGLLPQHPLAVVLKVSLDALGEAA